ncbi:MAG: ABC transporter permease subunit [Planctomycetes bacterium]|nr:ABC transporter permease subunit [Planctomycetota bacterium]
MNSARIDELRRTRPRSRLLRWSLALLALLAVWAWAGGEIDVAGAFGARRLENLRRFLSEDIRPYDLRGKPFDLSEHLAWCWHLGTDRGFAGALATLEISILAITLAGIWASILMLFAARNVASREPFESWVSSDGESARLRSRGGGWRLFSGLVRTLLVFLRAIPEYIWAFLLLGMLGPSAWPAVLALGMHNAGILGKLGAETVENLDPRTLRSLREIGASRAQVALCAILPLSLSRYLLYFFYRFETCVREATVLGMLGVASLGYWIQDSRTRQFYDEMLFFVALGACIVLAADLVSMLARWIVRRAA